MTWLLMAAAVLVLWAGIAALRRRSEYGHAAPRHPEGAPPRSAAAADDDEIDRAALEQAEREVRDLDALQRPEDGFAGDDWGPGAASR